MGFSQSVTFVATDTKLRSNEMTRKEALRSLDGVLQGYLLKEDINQIYDDHEAQLKLASDVYSTDKMHMYQELKAKDEEIERLKEQIKVLECRAYHAEGYIKDLHSNSKE